MSELSKAICSSIQDNKDKIEKLTKQNERLKKQNKQLKEDKRKAIEYINEHKHLSMFADCREPEEDWIYDLEINANELLEILGEKE